MISLQRDSDWKRIRTVISPTFTIGKLKRMTLLIVECVDTMNDNIDKIIAKGNGKLTAPVDMKPVIGAYIMESIIQVAFGRKVSFLDDTKNPIIENCRKMLSRGFVSNIRIAIILMTPKVAKMFKLTIFSKEITEFFRNLTLKLIDDTKRVVETGTPVKRVHFLHLMLESMKANNNEAMNGSEEYADSKSGEKYEDIQATDDMVDKSLSYDELIAQCMVFLTGGYESTANTLSICLYSIAKHPEVQQKLYEEINKFFEQKKSSDKSSETLYSLKYMDAVIDETLRLFPVLMSLQRAPGEDYELKGTGITIKKDHVCLDRKVHNPYTYLPFGAGPRNCLGMRMAMLEIKLALVNLVQRYVFHATEIKVFP
ncbi:unnamed protein product, partial [Oppiella nova]